MSTATEEARSDHDAGGGGRAWLARNGAAVLVAVGAAAATAHGLYEVAFASKVPEAIAWLYPLITDGLGAVAYTATGRLRGAAAGYAWGCVVLAAGLSGLAQAVYLATDTVAAVPVLRFGVGAWPAIACALVAHLLHLTLATDRADTSTTGRSTATAPSGSPGAAPLVAASAVRTDLPGQTVTVAALEAAPGHHSDPAPEPDRAVAPGDTATDSADDAGDGQSAVDTEPVDETSDARLRLLVDLLTAGVDVTGPQVEALLAHQLDSPVAARTARRLLAAAREERARQAVARRALNPALDPGRRHHLHLLPPTADGTTSTSTTASSTTSTTSTSDTEGEQ